MITPAHKLDPSLSIPVDFILHQTSDPYSLPDPHSQLTLEVMVQLEKLVEEVASTRRLLSELRGRFTRAVNSTSSSSSPWRSSTNAIGPSSTLASTLSRAAWFEMLVSPWGENYTVAQSSLDRSLQEQLDLLTLCA